MAINHWTTNDIPDLSGQVSVITGGNAGLGFKSCLELARKGAIVVIACRNIERGQAAVDKICNEIPDAKVEVILLDLINRESIERFAEAFTSKYQQLNILMNNGGVVNLERLQRTADGHEMHMATNHLGHFALAGRLAPILLVTPKARVVSLSSGGYRWGKIDFEDFKWKKRPYHRVKSYGDSKLANLLFAYELQNYFDKKGVDAISVSAHPGLTGTERQQSIGIGGAFTRLMAIPVAKGVLPQLRAAIDPTVKPRELYGPKYGFGISGPPVSQNIKPHALDAHVAKKLWDYSEQLTGVRYI